MIRYQPKMRYKDVTAHTLVANLCVEMAETVYETMCSGSNTIYQLNRDRKDFVQRVAPEYRQQARTILASLLTDPDTSEMEKEQIHEALTLDNALPKGGTSLIKKGTW